MPTLNEILESDQTNTAEVVSALKAALEKESSLCLTTEIKPSAFINLFKALEDNQTLTKLDLGAYLGFGFRSFILTNEALEALIVALQKNQHLTEVNIHNIHEDIILKLAPLLESNHPPLTKLSLSLTEKNHVEILANALRKNLSINHLNLSYNDAFNDQEAEKSLAQTLSKHPHLTHLTISARRGTSFLILLIEALKTNQTLSHFSYNSAHSTQENDPNNKTQISLFASLLKENKTLESLDLQSHNIGNTNASILANALKENPSITHLNLRGNEINVEGAQALAEALKQNTKLTHLDLAYNPIGEKGVAALFKALEENSTLKELNLACNHGIIKLNPETTNSFIKVLKQNPILSHLNLNRVVCDIQALAEALPHNKNLTELNLGCHEINGKSLQLLSTALRKHPTLTRLDLGSNIISDTDIPTLIELCNNTPNLQSLDLTCNHISYSGIQLLATFLETNQSLTHLNLNYNTLTGRSALQDLAQALKKNSRLTNLGFKFPQGSLTESEISEFYKTFDEILKVNQTITHLDIFTPYLINLAANEHYVSITKALKRNQILADKENLELIRQHLQESITPSHKALGSISPILSIIAHYVGLPFPKKRASSDSEKLVHPKTVTPPLKTNPESAPLSSPVSKSETNPISTPPKPLSFLDKLKKWWVATWNALGILIHNLLNTFKSKSTKTPEEISTQNQRPVLPLDKTTQGSEPQKEEIRSKTPDSIKKLEDSNPSNRKLKS